jgi:HD-GYP domain-containing protein (c-di-GMP phosphodiesterase class II)
MEVADREHTTSEGFLRLALAADAFEEYTHPHAARMARLVDEVASLFHLGRQDRASLKVATLAHDLGELAMRRDYIKGSGALSRDERYDLERHPIIGEQEAARAGADRGAQLLVRWHHEAWNGTGYPDHLLREQIPLGARILHVVDCYSALTDSRPFRPALTREDARRHLLEWAGLEFDPRVVVRFLSLPSLPELNSQAKSEGGDEIMSTRLVTSDIG